MGIERNVHPRVCVCMFWMSTWWPLINVHLQYHVSAITLHPQAHEHSHTAPTHARMNIPSPLPPVLGTMPCSVMMPSMRQAGVTSKEGFQTSISAATR